MSDRLAISASFSILMMAIYVLFGANVARVEFGPEASRGAPSALVGELAVTAGAVVARD